MHFLRFTRSSALLAYACLLPALFASCTKKEEAAPAPTVGKITGTISPATAIASVKAEGPSNSTTTVSPNTDSGDFSIANLAAGTYTLHFNANSGFLAPADRSVSVAAGETNALGSIRVSEYVVGKVEGSCSPANGLRSIKLTAPGAQNGPTVQPDVNGYFQFTNVEPGTYNVSFDPTPDFLAPAPRTITVTSRATTSLGVLTLTPAGYSTSPLRGSVRWTESGTAYTSTSLTGTLSLNNGLPESISLAATALNGNVTDALSLYSYCGSPGLYLMNNQVGGATAAYVRTVGGVPTGSYETRFQASPAGSVNITAIDPVARTVSGIFGFTAAEAPLRTGRIIISNGSFSLSY
jgi:hypothetical protein